MKILDWIKGSKLSNYFSSIFEKRKTLPEPISNEIHESKGTYNKEFKERLNKQANDISNMSQEQVIHKVLKELGLRESILMNKDAFNNIVQLIQDDMNITKIDLKNIEQVKSEIFEIVKDGRIEKEDETKNGEISDKKTTVIDVDEKGRTSIEKKSVHKQNENKFLEYSNKEKSDSEVLKESGYESLITYETTIIENGVEMEKSYERIENIASPLGTDKKVTVSRNADLVTASVEVKDCKKNEIRTTKDRWANTEYQGNPSKLTGPIDKEGEFFCITDIEKIDEMGESWCPGIIPSYTPKEEKQSLIEAEQKRGKKVFERFSNESEKEYE